MTSCYSSDIADRWLIDDVDRERYAGKCTKRLREIDLALAPKSATQTLSRKAAFSTLVQVLQRLPPAHGSPVGY